VTASTANRSRARAKPPISHKDKIAGTTLDVIELSSNQPEVEPEWVEIFRLDGKSYCVDKNLSAQVALEYLHLVRISGKEAAVAYLFEEMLGVEAYTALRSHKGITPTQIGQVLVALQAVLLGEDGIAPKA